MQAVGQHNHREPLEQSLLVDFALGKLPVDALELVARQTADCPGCQAALEALDEVEDSVLRDLRAGPLSGDAADPELDEQIRRVRETVQALWRDPGDDREDRPLAPPDDDHPPPGRPGQNELVVRVGRGGVDECSDAEPKRLGDFRIVRRIAHGGMGDIYEAIQEPLDRRVVVKTMRRGIASPQTRERFLREQHVLAKLHETHIVPIFAAGEDDAVQYFAMPFIEGASLNHIVRTAARLAGRERQRLAPRLGEFAKITIGHTTDATKDTDAGGDTESRRGPVSQPNAESEEKTDGPLSLSPEYIHSVVEVMADVAESLENAHRHGFLHRDLKPSNIMVDTSGQGWIIDFGLAGYVRGELEALPAAGGGDEPLTALTAGAIGTPGYMSPEQSLGQTVDARTDVWGLGVTLYELLTLRRAFPRVGRQADDRSGPPGPPLHPRELAKNLPRDLEAVCLKALEPDCGHRYQTSQEVADDLRRWLRSEPVLARPARTPRRVLLWSKRNKAWATAIVVAVLAFFAVAGAVITGERVRARTAERESLMLQSRAILAGNRMDGWSSRAWELIRQAAEIRRDEVLQSEAASVLLDLDAVVEKRFEEFGAGRLLFDPKGERLLLGAVVESQKEQIDDGAVPSPAQPLESRVWNADTDEVRKCGLVGDGPIGFREDGTPLQLAVRAETNNAVLLDLWTRHEVASYAPRAGSTLAETAAAAMTEDASRVAVAAEGGDGSRRLLVWEGGSGKLLHDLAGISDVPAARPGRGLSSRTGLHSLAGAGEVLAISPDGALLAGGGPGGNIHVWSLASGKALYCLRAGSNPVHCLSFGKDRHRTVRGEAAFEGQGWLLAAGHAGGRVMVWELGAGIPRSYCLGSDHDVYTVAFSPDGATLASSGRTVVKLWDLATGRGLLNISAGSFINGLAFSPDGAKLAVGSMPAFNPGRVDVWRLSAGRGMRALRGLVAPISKIRFSADGRLVAGLSHNWKAGVWDVASGELRHVLPFPRGLVADNAALAFDTRGERLALCAGKEAMLWDLVHGKQLDWWDLPEGMSDCLAFSGDGRLLLFRVETKDGEVGPYSEFPPAEHPRVCRLRDLLSPSREKPLAEIEDFNWYVFNAMAAPDGSCFVVDGLGGPAGRRRAVQVYGPDGKLLYGLPTTRVYPSNWMAIDPSSNFLMLDLDDDFRNPLIRLSSGVPSGEVVGPHAACIGFQGRIWLESLGRRGLSLVQTRDERRLVTLGTDKNGSGIEPQFDRSGNLVAWGTSDGTVLLCTIGEVNRMLSEVGMGW